MLININATEGRAVALPRLPGGAAYSLWTLTAGKGGVFGGLTLLNGRLLPAQIADGEALTKIPVPAVAHTGGQLNLPPFSVTFGAAAVCVPAAEYK